MSYVSATQNVSAFPFGRQAPLLTLLNLWFLMHVIRKCIGQSVMNADMQRRRGKKPTISLCGISQRARRFVSLTTSSRQTMKLRTKEWKEVESTEIYGRKSFSWQRSITSYGNPEISTLHSKYFPPKEREKRKLSFDLSIKERNCSVWQKAGLECIQNTESLYG